MTKKHYDYFVIGAGSGGVRSARIAAQHGAKVGIAEASDLGGTCVNLGCIPKKLLAYASDYHAHFVDARGYGWDTPDDIPFNWPDLISHKNNEISRLNDIYESLLEKAGVDLFNGYARFIDNKTVEINGEKITADKFLIAVGGKPRPPEWDGAEHAVTSDEAFFLPELPKHVVIVGGGYIAVEFAHILKGMGAKVTLLYRGHLFLRGFDSTIRLALAEEMRKQGIDLRFSCDVARIEQSGDGYKVHTTTDDVVDCDLVLAAIGRIPNTNKLGLDNTAIKTSCGGFIEVNDHYQTAEGNIYAVGDVTDTAQLTPVAIQEGHALADRLFSKNKREVNYDYIATAVFSDPPMSTVGITEEEALEKGYEIMCYVSDFKPMKHTLSGRDERSVMKLIVDCKTDKVLGLHMMGLDAPEIMQGFAVALNCGATKAVFDRTMAMHPTSAEEFVLMRNGMHIKPEDQNK